MKNVLGWGWVWRAKSMFEDQPRRAGFKVGMFGESGCFSYRAGRDGRVARRTVAFV